MSQEPETRKTIWTIGHSTMPVEAFIEIIKTFGIKIVADIRSYPGSRFVPWFNREVFQKTLEEFGIGYIHMEELGGRRRTRKDSPNTIWKNESFRGYADYMETDNFTRAAEELEKLAMNEKVVMMCAEALWWRCHRSMVADFLKLSGWMVIHILGNGKTEEHPYTRQARIIDGRLTYHSGETKG